MSKGTHRGRGEQAPRKPAKGSKPSDPAPRCTPFNRPKPAPATPEPARPPAPATPTPDPTPSAPEYPPAVAARQVDGAWCILETGRTDHVLGVDGGFSVVPRPDAWVTMRQYGFKHYHEPPRVLDPAPPAAWVTFAEGVRRYPAVGRLIQDGLESTRLHPEFRLWALDVGMRDIEELRRWIASQPEEVDRMLLACGAPARGSEAFRRAAAPLGTWERNRYLGDDPKGARAVTALRWARRRWDERATSTGTDGAVALHRLLALAVAAMRSDLDVVLGKDDRRRAVVKLGDDAWRVLSGWDRTVAAARERANGKLLLQRQSGTVDPATEEECRRLDGLQDLAPMTVETARPAARSHDWTVRNAAVCTLRDRLLGHLQHVAMSVYHGQRMWNATAFPNCPASVLDCGGPVDPEGRDASSTVVAVGALQYLAPYLTHRGESFEERSASVARVVHCIAARWNAQQTDWIERLQGAAAVSDATKDPGRLQSAQVAVAQEMTRAAIAGLLDANGEPRTAAMRKARTWCPWRVGRPARSR